MKEQYELEREEKRKQFLNQLRDIMSSNASYTRYLETLGNSKYIKNSYSIQTLKVIYSCFMMALWNDKYIEKDENNEVITTLSDELLDEILDLISTKKDDKYYIGDISFNKNSELLKVLKDKLTHGDFLIKDKYIVLEIEGKKGLIKINDIVDFTSDLSTNFEKMYATKPNTQIFISMINTKKRMQSRKDVIRNIEKMNYIEIQDEPLEEHIRTKKYKNLLESFIKDLVEYTEYNNLNELKKKYNNRLVRLGVNLKFKITPVINLSNINELIEDVCRNKSFIKESNTDKQMNYLAYAIYEKYTKDAHKKNINEGILINQELLDSLEEDIEEKENRPFRKLFKLNDKVSLPEKSKLDKCILSSYLCGFYAVYIYGLDKIYTDDERNSIVTLYENKMFDFSKINIKNLNCTKLIISKDYKCFTEQTKKDEKKLEKLREKITEKIDDYKKSAAKEETEKLKEALKKQRNILLKKKEEYSNLRRRITFENKFLEKNNDKYVENRNIIEHIRNSISHGNVEFNYTKSFGKRDNSIITFKDYEKEESTFDASITTKDFNNIISGDNFKIIEEYLEQNNNNYKNEETIKIVRKGL